MEHNACAAFPYSPTVPAVVPHCVFCDAPRFAMLCTIQCPALSNIPDHVMFSEASLHGEHKAPDVAATLLEPTSQSTKMQHAPENHTALQNVCPICSMNMALEPMTLKHTGA